MNSKPAKKERESKVPADLVKALRANSKAKATWKDLTPIARRDFIGWIDGARQLETRERRIKRTWEMLVAGKRRPCCYAIVPMNLYKALSANPKAKATWKDLTPLERRDFVGFIDGAKVPDIRTKRIEKVCAMLMSGKRRP